MLARALDVLFPRRCVGCGHGPWPVCAACRGRSAYLGPPGCARCGRPLEHEVPRCVDCPPAAVSWARAPFLYEGPIRAALMRLKFDGLSSIASGLAPWMVEALARSPPDGFSLDAAPGSVITWVPLGRRRRRSRGYDQAQALARAVADVAGWELAPLLARTVETAPQARRRGSERRRDLSAAFLVASIPPDRVLLIDDVLTSGATSGACARALRSAGARQVGLLTAARSLGGGVPARCYNPPGLQPGSVVAREIISR